MEIVLTGHVASVPNEVGQASSGTALCALPGNDPAESSEEEHVSGTESEEVEPD